jgi:hypothetical protein
MRSHGLGSVSEGKMLDSQIFESLLGGMFVMEALDGAQIRVGRGSRVNDTYRERANSEQRNKLLDPDGREAAL